MTKYDSMIVCPDSNAGYMALHEAIQHGWEPIFHWFDKLNSSNCIMLRRSVPDQHSLEHGDAQGPSDRISHHQQERDK